MNINTHSTVLALASSQYWSITDGAQTGLDLSTAFTFETWLKLTQLPSSAAAKMTLISKYLSTNFNRSFLWDITTADKVNVTVSDDGTSANTHLIVFESDTSPFSINTWYHLAATFDAASEALVMYLDGVILANSIVAGSSFGAAIHNSGEPFMIGKGESTTYFDGKLDDTRVWNVVRTQAEIKRNMHLQLNANQSGLVLYNKWNNDGNDSSGNGNNLTNNNTATFSATDKAPIRRIY